jgi:dihydroneopterin aldolase
MGEQMARPGLRHVFLRDMVLQGRIGVHPHEHGRVQRVRINVDLGVAEEAGGPARDELGLVVDYSRLVRSVREAVQSGHVRLVETLAERIAESSFFDQRIQSVRVRVEKLDVYEDAESVGVEIERRAPGLSTRTD